MRRNIIYPLKESFIEYPDNISCSVSIYMPGCDNNCPGCQNPELKDPNYIEGSVSCTVKELMALSTIACRKMMTNKVVMMGGDPLSTYNIDFTREFVSLYGKEFDICIYTGKSMDFVQKNRIEGYTFIKTGCYSLSEKTSSFKNSRMMQLASTNQRLFNKSGRCISIEGKIPFEGETHV